MINRPGIVLTVLICVVAAGMIYEAMRSRYLDRICERQVLCQDRDYDGHMPEVP